MQLLDMNSAAKMLAVSPWTLRVWERQGRLQAVRLGGAVRFEVDELERFIARAKATPGQRPAREVSR